MTMTLSIIRHAIAVPRGTAGYPGDDRPLTPEGRKKMKQAAAGIVRILPRPDAILTSPLSRARETAQITSAAYPDPVAMDTTDVLLPGGSIAAVLETIRERGDGHVLLVGHEPDLTMLVGHLLGTDGTKFELKKGGLVHLSATITAAGATATLLWYLKPKHLRMLGAENHA